MTSIIKPNREVRTQDDGTRENGTSIGEHAMHVTRTCSHGTRLLRRNLLLHVARVAARSHTTAPSTGIPQQPVIPQALPTTPVPPPSGSDLWLPHLPQLELGARIGGVTSRLPYVAEHLASGQMCIDSLKLLVLRAGAEATHLANSPRHDHPPPGEQDRAKSNRPPRTRNIARPRPTMPRAQPYRGAAAVMQGGIRAKCPLGLQTIFRM